MIARWLSMDPADEFHSPYVYVGNDPVNFVDPDGRQVFSDIKLEYENTKNLSPEGLEVYENTKLILGITSLAILASPAFYTLYTEACIATYVYGGYYLGNSLGKLQSYPIINKSVDLAKTFFGYAFDTKPNNGGFLQPKGVNGRFLPYSANPGIKGSPATQNIFQFFQGYGQAFGCDQWFPPQGGMQKALYWSGYTYGNFGGYFPEIYEGTKDLYNGAKQNMNNLKLPIYRPLYGL